MAQTNPIEREDDALPGDPVPLMQERLRGDPFYDLIVPRYSALATAEPTRIVVIGVWLLMVPSAVLGILVLWMQVPEQSLLLKALSWCVMAVVSITELWIVWKVTKRRSAHKNIESEATE